MCGTSVTQGLDRLRIDDQLQLGDVPGKSLCRRGSPSTRRVPPTAFGYLHSVRLHLLAFSTSSLSATALLIASLIVIQAPTITTMCIGVVVVNWLSLDKRVRLVLFLLCDMRAERSCVSTNDRCFTPLSREVHLVQLDSQLVPT